jgi:hypothetical protein
MSKAAELANLIGNINAGGGGVNRNCIINGAMNVAQRGTSTTGLKNTGAIYTIDRFSYRRAGTWTNFDSKHEQVDVTDALPSSKGFYKGLRVTCTTAEGSVPSGTECTGIGYYIEKQDLYKFCVGSSSMKTTVISFYVKASIATTYGFTIQAPAHSTTQQIDIPFTVSSANTYEKISITIPTYNVAFDSTADNAAGWYLFWGLDGVPSSRTASAWGGSSDGFIMPNGVSATGFSNTLNATFEITGVQLEVGQNPTEFEHEPIERTLAKCQRYYFLLIEGDNEPVCQGGMFDGDSFIGEVNFPVTMRAAPTLDEVEGTSFFRLVRNNGTDDCDSVAINRDGTDVCHIEMEGNVSGTAGHQVMVRSNNSSAKIAFKAEL